MSSSYPKVLPAGQRSESVPTLEPVPVLDQRDVARATPERKKSSDGFGSWLRAFFGWVVRWFIGALCCTTYLTAVLVVGWTYRWMRGRVIKSWWKRSRYAKEGSFEDWCVKQGRGAPDLRPRWVMRNRIRATLAPESYGLKKPSHLQQFLRLVSIPWHSLWLNLKTGVAGLFCTYLITGWGSLLLYFGWIYGWQNSFNKNYEEAGYGVLVSVIGILLFLLGTFYVLMAQVHHAVCGDRRAFFEFRFVWRLIQARSTAYFWLFVLIVAATIPIEVMRVAIIGENMFGNNQELTNGQVLAQFFAYLFFWSLLYFFPVWLLTRWLMARIYASAVMKVLRDGDVPKEQLHPELASLLDRLDVMPIPKVSTPLIYAVKKGSGWTYRKLVFAAMFFIAILWIFPVRYAGQFFNYVPFTGFMNTELVQVPTVGIIPYHLLTADPQQKGDARL